MVLTANPSSRTTWVLSQIKNRDGILPPHFTFQSHLSSSQRDSTPFPSSPSSIAQTPPSSPPPNSRISPAVLFIIVILAVIFFISGLLHLLVRFLIKKHPSSSSLSNGHPSIEVSGSDSLQRQLQQLFHLHDSGLDQAFIDALPVFLYREIVGSKEPFDCAVCLCEFAADDKLRLLPVCGHAFHLNCIDTWLLSNSTCPLCRGALFIQGLTIENPIFDFDEMCNDGSSEDREDGIHLPGKKQAELEEGVAEKKVFPVRLGKFKSVSNSVGVVTCVEGNDGSASIISNVRRELGESSSSNLDARRCYSMGSFQYVVGDANLQVELCSSSRKRGDGKGLKGRLLIGNTEADEGMEGKRLCAASKGESLSVSKIWLWPNKKGKFASSSDTSSLDGGLPWMGRSIRDT